MIRIDLDGCHAEIAPGLRRALGEKLRAASAEKSFRCAVVTDRRAGRFYLEDVKKSLEKAGVEAVDFILAPGERSKSLRNYALLVEFLAANRFTRTDAVLALGGGIVGDLAGFAASTYLRGVRFFQAPTTLLAMIDSSVGGKCAVNLSAGKNLCGSFYLPEKIFADTETLATLPEKTFADGAAEAVKYGMICDRELFDRIASGALEFDLDATISRCIGIKAKIVSRDLFDRGERRLLNFGHTLGHAIEIVSNFTFSHGRAVAVGMAETVRAAARKNLCAASCVEALEKTLLKLGLPTENPYPLTSLIEVMLADKKRHGDTLELVVPREIGRAGLYPVNVDQLEDFFAR